MKIMLRNLILLTAACSMLAAHAQSAPKIAVVDMEKVFSSFFKTKAAQANIEDRVNDSGKYEKTLLNDYQKANEDYKKLIDGTTDQAVSSDEREKRKKLAEQKIQEIREIQTSIEAFRNQARASLDEQKKRLHDNLLREIREEVNKQVKREGYTLAFNSSDVQGVPVLLYNVGGGNDLTDKVIEALNSDPLNRPTKPDDAKPADAKDDKKDPKKKQ